MYIVLEPTPLNVSTASTKKGCEPLPGVLSVFIEDVDLVFNVIAPADDILKKSEVYELAVLYVNDCPSASVPLTVPTEEPLTTNSDIVNPFVLIVGAVLGKNTFSIKFDTEPLVPKLTLYMFDGKSVLDIILLPSNDDTLPPTNDAVATDVIWFELLTNPVGTFVSCVKSDTPPPAPNPLLAADAEMYESVTTDVICAEELIVPAGTDVK
jgi:hypothetical protein